MKNPVKTAFVGRFRHSPSDSGGYYWIRLDYSGLGMAGTDSTPAVRRMVAIATAKRFVVLGVWE